MREAIKINEVCFDKEEVRLIEEVLKSGILTNKNGMGPKVLEFERAFADYIGVKYSVAVSSGTAALHAALMALDLKHKDEVILPSLTFPAAAEAVVLTGAIPIFADVSEETYCIDVESIEDSLSKNTKVIIPVHLYGLPADMDPIMKLAEDNDIAVIEDGAQAHGALYKARKVGSIGDMGCFSFYATKNMTTGEGGIVTSNNKEYVEALRAIRNHGESRENWNTRLGHNYRMSEIQAALGIAQLKKLPEFIEKRRNNAKRLSEELNDVNNLILPKEPEGFTHAWNLYTVRVKGVNATRRNKIVAKLREKGIYATVYYETPTHLLPFYMGIDDRRKKDLTKTEKIVHQIFSLPIHPKVSPEDIEYMSKTLKKIMNKL
ncbi:DegT/DnrJ/EryC1/StrS family aminotransferase [Candidatus Bathyarchaeota archaeon]|nr:DegT/DnrJ/EryC1/StrS family aminotransferase [Candidatus Bathyarchaeota archaeon]